MLRRLRPVGLTTALAAVTLLAAACGASATTTEVQANNVPTEEVVPAAETDESAGPVTESEPGAEVAAAANLFPDVDVVNIVDASTFNLAAELGGGDLPVLLWFWAPH